MTILGRFKKRISLTLTEYYKNGDIVVLSRRVPSRMYDLIKNSKAEEMSVKVIYKKGAENETAIGNKKYVRTTLKLFLSRDLIKDAMSEKCIGI